MVSVDDEWVTMLCRTMAMWSSYGPACVRLMHRVVVAAMNVGRLAMLMLNHFGVGRGPHEKRDDGCYCCDYSQNECCSC